MRLISPAYDRIRHTVFGSDRPVNIENTALFNEALLRRLRQLTIASKRTIPEGLAGEHRSRRRGSSPEFSDFKSYSPGDDFRRIDWNIYGRLDELFVRISEVTTEVTLHILLDLSNSMAWRSDETLPTKRRFAAQIAGSLGYISLWHFDRVTITPFGETLGTPFGPVQGHARVTSMFRYLAGLPAMGATDLPTVLNRYSHLQRRPGLLLLVSDLLSGESAQVTDALRTLRARGWQIIVVHVIDPDELSPNYLSAPRGGHPISTELIDLETHERLTLLPTQQVLRQYQAAVEQWFMLIEQACHDDAIDYVRLQTDWPIETMVLKFLHRRGIVT